MSLCQRCDSVNDDKDCFCTYCGELLATTNETTKPTILMYCSTCSIVSKGANEVCGLCGTSLIRSYETTKRKGFTKAKASRPKEFTKGEPDNYKVYIGMIFTFFVLWQLVGSDSNSSPDYPSLTHQNKINMCKKVIGNSYHKSTSMIHESNTSAQDTSDIVRVEYTRTSDRTLWRYACHITSNIIVYNTWQKDINDWGRWRYDEEVTYTIKRKEDGNYRIQINF